MKSHMTHQFSQIPKVDIPRSVFNRSHGHKTTFMSGFLIPFYVDEALPGDSFTARTSMFARLATPIKPIMDNLFLETFYFAVPVRLLWDNWQKFNGEQANPGESTDYVVPTLQTTVAAEGNVNNIPPQSLGDYFGLPVNVGGLSISALWHRAYNLIFNEWFRDQNLVNSARILTGDGPDSILDNYPLRRRGKRHDYFTSALPWPQKGPGVMLPLGTTAPVYGTTPFKLTNNGADQYDMFFSGATQLTGKVKHSNSNIGDTITGGFVQAGSFDRVEGLQIRQNQTGLIADLASASAATINSLRQAFQLQRMHERDARGGTRYTEIIKAHFGVTSPDSRLQRPEYLGGSSSPVSINPVQKTASTDTTSPQGNLAAFGLCAANGGFTKSFTEHTILIGLVNVRADLTYQQGIPRMFSRKTRYDFYWPALAHLGEQEILNKEIYATGTVTDNQIFGYQERYAEYRYKPSQITGKFRSTFEQTLDIWHLAQEFTSLPTLNETFINDYPPIARVIAVPGNPEDPEPEFLLDTYMDLKCARPMPVYSVPGLIDHF